MRTALGAALVLVAGCNKIFGLDPVQLQDGGPGEVIIIDGPLPTVKVLAIQPGLDTFGALTNEAQLVPIVPTPTVVYGRIGEEPRPAPYNETNGEVSIATEFAALDTKWRLVYTPFDGVPREVQWKPEAGSQAVATLLQLSPSTRAMMPTNASYRLTPTGAPFYELPRVYTTNMWTTTASPVVTGTSLDVPFAGAGTVAQAGPKRRPDPAIDRQVAFDYEQGTCTTAKATAVYRAELTGMNSTDPSMPAWLVSPPATRETARTVVIPSGFDVIAMEDFVAGYGVASGNLWKRQALFKSPATKIPLLNVTDPLFGLRVPAGLLSVVCSDRADTQTTALAAPIATNLNLLDVGVVQLSTPGLPLAGGPSVHIGVTAAQVQAAGTIAFDFTKLVLPFEPTIDGLDAKITLGGTLAVPAGTALATLRFKLNLLGANNEQPPHFYEATLFKIEAGQLVRVREFTFTHEGAIAQGTEVALQFDRNQGVPASTPLVFEVRAIRGTTLDNAAKANFGVWGDNQSVTNTYTRPFTLAL